MILVAGVIHIHNVEEYWGAVLVSCLVACCPALADLQLHVRGTAAAAALAGLTALTRLDVTVACVDEPETATAVKHVAALAGLRKLHLRLLLGAPAPVGADSDSESAGQQAGGEEDAGAGVGQDGPGEDAASESDAGEQAGGDEGAFGGGDEGAFGGGNEGAGDAGAEVDAAAGGAGAAAAGEEESDDEGAEAGAAQHAHEGTVDWLGAWDATEAAKTPQWVPVLLPLTGLRQLTSCSVWLATIEHSHGNDIAKHMNVTEVSNWEFNSAAKPVKVAGVG